jgi:mono/diheme cytochrome c family protein
MKPNRFATLALTMSGTLLTTFLVSATPAAPSAAQAAAGRVERGRYLVSAMGCHDCHTPWKMGPKGPEPDMSRALTGHPQDLAVTPPPSLGTGSWAWMGSATNTAFAGPWGISFTANLTPDKATGLGDWTEETFIATLRTGRHLGKGRPIKPPMPWPMIGKLNDEDLKSIFAYLQSLKPVVNKVPATVDPPEAGQE